MTLTNTNSVGKNWSRYKVFSRFTWQAPNQMLSQLNDQLNDQVNEEVNVQVNNQLDDQVFYQISPIKTKINKEFKK